MTPQFLRKLPIIAVTGLVLGLCAKFFLPIAMPFLLAVLVALASEPLVSNLENRFRLPRVAATALGVTGVLLGLVFGILLLGRLLMRQLQGLAGIVPDLAGAAASGMDALRRLGLRVAQRAPSDLSPILTQGITNLFSDGSALLDKMVAWVLRLASGFVSRLPDSALGVGTWLVASFMISSKLPKMRMWVRAHLPESWEKTYLPTVKRLKKSVFGWLWAQVKMVSITFCVLLGGFWLLRVKHAFVWAFLISLVDILPILGTGTVLIPWSVVAFLQGNGVLGVGILAIYGAATLLRAILEPKLVGKQLGLDSLVTLIAMYAGYRLWGIGGLILAPILAVVGAQLMTPQKN